MVVVMGISSAILVKSALWMWHSHGLGLLARYGTLKSVGSINVFGTHLPHDSLPGFGTLVAAGSHSSYVTDPKRGSLHRCGTISL